MDIRDHSDVLIVGSGPVGAVFARLLVEAGKSVAMLETGATVSEPPGEHLANAFQYQQQPNLFLDVMLSKLETFSQPEKLFGKYRGLYRKNYENPDQKTFRNMPLASAIYGVGGMATIWTAACPRHEDFELSPLIPLLEWRRLLAVADKMLDVNTDVFEGSFLGRALKEHLNEDLADAPYHQLPVAAQRNGKFVRWTGTSTILGPILERNEKYGDRFQLLAQHRAERIQHDGSRVSGVVVNDILGHQERVLTADQYVVCAGSFLTPRLLWQSGIRPKALGHYLHDHTQTSCQVIIGKRLMNLIRSEKDNPCRDDPMPIPRDEERPMIGMAPSKTKPWHMQMHGAGRKFAYLGRRDVREVLEFSYYGMVSPKYENHISFSETLSDRFGQPQITIHFRWSWRDVWQMLRMWWDMVKTARRVGRIKLLPPPLPSMPGTTLHLMGTYRMGTEDQREESVVDLESKVHGFENLRLGGLGVLPHTNASNPTNVACALAVRSAADLLGATVAEVSRLFESGETAYTKSTDSTAK